MVKTTDESRRPLTLSEKIRNVCIGLGAVSGLILGLVANCRGEPVAEKTWDTLRGEVNKQSTAINRIHARLVYLQAHEEGRHAADLQIRLEALQKQYDSLKSKLPLREIKVTGRAITPSPCKDGHIEVGGLCKKVAPAIAKKVEAQEQAAAAAKKKLLEEKRRAESLEKKLDSVQKNQKPLQDLLHLPEKLADVKEE